MMNPNPSGQGLANGSQLSATSAMSDDSDELEAALKQMNLKKKKG
jgi:hypothetical protein